MLHTLSQRPTAAEVRRVRAPSYWSLIALVATFAVVAFVFLGPDERPETAQVPDERVAVAGFPRDVEFLAGHRVTIKTRPERIVPASAATVDYLAALVEPSRIAGVPNTALEYSTLLVIEREAWADVPTFDAYLAENVLALNPDLVLADPWGAVESNQRLEESGVDVLVLPETRSWAEARSVLLKLGEVLGEEERAAGVVEGLEKRVRRLESEAEARGTVRAMSYANWTSGGWTAGGDTTIDAVLTLAGLENAAAGAGIVGHSRIGYEELVTLDPEWILVSKPLAGAEHPGDDRGGASESVLRGEPVLAGLQAVREDRILALDPWLFATASHQIVRAAEELVEALDERR